jgi:NAD(P)-dependent dehydrogenase (short-subunit alcohol dehydrogenase family)
MQWTSADIPGQKGKTFIVTGGNTGIGLATVDTLAGKGGTVVLACRNIDKGSAALAKIRRSNPNADVVVEQLNLASLASVRAFAERVTSRYRRLDVLINNAGVALPPLGRTEDGFETQFGTNVLGHFALTGHLLPLLLQSPQSRVVTMSSTAHWFGKIDFENLNAERRYAKTPAYNQSKLADLMFAYELQRRLAKRGAATISVGVHPGVVMSELFRHSKALNLFLSLLSQSIEDGALPSLMAAVEPSVKGGDYIGPGGFLTIKGLPTVQKSSVRSHDQAVAARLWEVAQKLSGVSYL